MYIEKLLVLFSFEKLDEMWGISRYGVRMYSAVFYESTAGYI